MYWRNREDILGTYRDGDELGWDVEFKWILENSTEKLLDLLRKIQVEGIREPILLGTDGRIWDGHHRLLVARILNIEFIPVERAK